MEHDLGRRRRDYTLTTLDDGAATSPWELFGAWFDEATRAEADGAVYEATAMTVATAVALSGGGWQPQTRVVLLKSWDERGLVFFTNQDSAKGQALAANPHACLHFHWAPLQRQVRLDCEVTLVDAATSEAYFATRPRGSQVGAHASRQSQPTDTREALEQVYHETEQRFEGQDVPRPEHWGGYRCVPHRVEFWQGRPSRLHDRLVFTRDGEAWTVTRLQP